MRTQTQAPWGVQGITECEACGRAHKTLTGKLVPACKAHRGTGECDLRGSHLCGPSELSLALGAMFAGVKR